MEQALADVLDAIARGAGAPADAERRRLGSVELRPGQADAARRVSDAIAEFGGAILADAPGTGKTYVALAVARAFDRCVVLAPASLRAMWHDAARAANIRVTFVSLEAVSRDARVPDAPFLIVDEAHRAATRRTRRYRRLTALAARTPLLLLTATPVRNRPDELIALLALFRGPDAGRMAPAVLPRCVVRSATAEPVTVRDGRLLTAPPVRGLAAALQALPPPALLADGSDGRGLVAIGLARAWCSSLAALDAALARRLHRGAAMLDTLRDGRLPSQRELRAWVVGDDSSQVAFSFLASPFESDAITPAIDAVEAHLRGVRRIRALVGPAVDRDIRARAQFLRGIVAELRPGGAVVAFTVSATTARSLFRALRHVPGAALLTSAGARTAGGPVARHDIVSALDPATAAPSSSRFAIRLVIATDLLSEGVNLQRASDVVHLDDPWTPAAVSQRNGRVARIGSIHRQVTVHRIDPPPAAARLVDMAARHRTKRRASARALSPGEAWSAFRATVAPWRSTAPSARWSAAACAGTVDAAIVLVHDHDRAVLLAGQPVASGRWRMTNDPRALLKTATAVTASPQTLPAHALAAIERAVARWIRGHQAARNAGVDHVASRDRQALVRRIETVLAGCPPSCRPQAADLGHRARHALSHLHGSAAEATFAQVLADPAAPLEWLARTVRVLEIAGRGGTLPTPVAETAALVAVLLVRRERAAVNAPVSPRPVLSPAPPAACSGTAALR